MKTYPKKILKQLVSSICYNPCIQKLWPKSCRYTNIYIYYISTFLFIFTCQLKCRVHIRPIVYVYTYIEVYHALRRDILVDSILYLMLIRQLQTSRNLKERFYTGDLFYKDYRLHSNFFIKFQNFTKSHIFCLSAPFVLVEWIVLFSIKRLSDFTNKPPQHLSTPFLPPFFLLGDKESPFVCK